MKKLLTLLLLTLPLIVFSQNEKITVDTKDLPPELVKQLKQKQQVTETLQTYGEWAGIGSEIGIAMKEGLTAVKDVAVDFSKTDVGTYTMVLIAWKVVGQDITGIFVGLLSFLIGVPIIIWSYKRSCMARRVCIKDEGWFKAKEYKIIEIDGDINVAAAIFLHALAFFILIAINCAIIF